MTYTTVTNFTEISLDSHIKTVLLDLDNTCYQYDPCHTTGLKKLQIAIEQITGPLPDFSEHYHTAQKHVKDRIPTLAASHSRALYIQALFEQLGRTDGHTHVVALENAYWEAFFTQMELVVGLTDFLAECRKSGKTVVVVSDLTTVIQCQKLAALGIAEAIDFLVTAEEVGADKPDSKPFLSGLEKAQSEPHTAVVIGDNYERDIQGAQALGIDGILIIHDTENKKLPVR